MTEPIKKRVDESWKEQAEREKQVAEAKAASTAPPSPPEEATSEAVEATEESAKARFDMFVSGLVMETLIAMGDMAHPTTRKQSTNLAQAKYLIDLLGVLEEKTKGNLSVDEDKLLKDALYQLRMRYLSKSGGS